MGMLSASAVAAQKLEGTIALGGIYLDESGDRTSMQETYNVFDGFSVTQLRLTGSFNPKNTFALNLREVNLDSRKGEFVYRIPGRLRLNTRYDQWRQLFNPDGTVASKRKDWHAGLDITTGKGGKLITDYNYQNKTGGRLGYPLGTMSALGTQYDYTLQTGMIEGSYKPGTVGVALTYNFADYKDRSSPVQDRFGQVISARLYGSAYFWPDKLTHLLRGAYGKQKLSQSGLNFKMLNFQYTGVLRPHERFQFKYNFYANEIDDQGTRLKTNNLENNFVLTYYHNYGQIYGGYGHETNNDDLALTTYQTYVIGASGNYKKRLRAQIEYGNRNKNDRGQRTLLQDIESNKFMANVRYKPTDDAYIGGKFKFRQRKFTSINVEAEGHLANIYGGYDYSGWGSFVTDVSYSVDDYDDLVGSFKASNQIVTARLQIDRVRDLVLVGGVTYLNIGEDLNIEKSILFFEGVYTVKQDYHIELKYNVYNYDDYIICSKYYTANVVWFNLAYDFRKN